MMRARRRRLARVSWVRSAQALLVVFCACWVWLVVLLANMAIDVWAERNSTHLVAEQRR